MAVWPDIETPAVCSAACIPTGSTTGIRSKPFKFRGIRIAFYDYYYPSRYNDFLNEAQRTFCRSIYRFKQGEIHGIEFFKACMTAIQADGKPYHTHVHAVQQLDKV